MPELPEVHTTVTGLAKVLPKLAITSIWTDMWSSAALSKNTIKDKSYFPYFKKNVLNKKIVSVKRRAKHILVSFDNGYTMIIHMKMTGHLMYGTYKQNKNYNGREWPWIPVAPKNSPLHDPYNRHIHVVFSLSNGKHLAFCDSRKFGSIEVVKSDRLHTDRLSHLGPEPLEETFTLNNFKERLLKSSRPIKTVLMDQTIIAGIGNIYSDEMLHLAHVNPMRTTKTLTDPEWKLLFKSMKLVLSKGIDFGGDSTSDYRNIHGDRGKFHHNHNVYLRKNENCLLKNCKGTIQKKTINGRSAHFCSVCQK